MGLVPRFLWGYLKHLDSCWCFDPERGVFCFFSRFITFYSIAHLSIDACFASQYLIASLNPQTTYMVMVGKKLEFVWATGNTGGGGDKCI